MNERIEGLWWKARIGYNNQNCDPEVLEKFAELIVQECMEVAGKDWHTPDGWGYTFGQKKAIEFIKEHFGVEE